MEPLLTRCGAAERIERVASTLRSPDAVADCVLLILGIDGRFNTER